MVAELLLFARCVDGAPACALEFGSDYMAHIQAQASQVVPPGHHLARHQGKMI